MMETQTSVNLDFVNKLREQVNNNQFMLSYKGQISDDIIMPLLAMTEKKLDLSGAANSIKSRVFNVMVECLQNIERHGSKNEHKKSSMFMIESCDQGYLIYSGNAIPSSKVDEIKGKLLKINTMSKEELKEFYKYWINSQEFSDKGGAGLGFIDMARKTGNPLDFDFEYIDDSYCFFLLRTLVNNKKKDN